MGVEQCILLLVMKDNLACYIASQGYALIEYETFEDAQKAIAEMDGGELLTQTIAVDWAFSRGPYKRRNARRRYVLSVYLCIF